MPRTASLPIVIALALAQAVLLVPSGSALQQVYNISTSFPDWYGHVNGLLTYSPTAAQLRADPALQHRVRPLFNMFDSLYNATVADQNSWSERTCSLFPQSTWVISGRDRVKVYQLGTFVRDCMSRLDLKTAPAAHKAIPRGYDTTVFETIVAARKALFAAANRSSLHAALVARMTRDLWPRLTVMTDFTFLNAHQECKSEFIFAYLVHGEWYVQAETTNLPLSVAPGRNRRQFTNEYISRDWRALGLVHELPDGSRRAINASTVLTRWNGAVSPGTVWLDHARDRETAAAEALGLNAISIERARNDITPSNTAVLALPMVMTLVPVAFVADLDVLGMLVYAIATDVFSTLPFLIKGVELVLATKAGRSATVAMFMGNATLGQMEVSTARCKAERTFGTTGWAFLGVGVGCMALGIALELAAARSMRRRRRESGDEAEGPLGAAVLKATSRGLLGRRRRDERRWRSAKERDEEGLAAACEERYSEEWGKEPVSV